MSMEPILFSFATGSFSHSCFFYFWNLFKNFIVCFFGRKLLYWTSKHFTTTELKDAYVVGGGWCLSRQRRTWCNGGLFLVAVVQC